MPIIRKTLYKQCSSTLTILCQSDGVELHIIKTDKYGNAPGMAVLNRAIGHIMDNYDNLSSLSNVGSYGQKCFS